LVFLGDWEDEKFAKMPKILQNTLENYANGEVYKKLDQYDITGAAKINPFLTHSFSYKEGGRTVRLPDPPGYYQNETPPISTGAGFQEQVEGEFAQAITKLIPQISPATSPNMTENEQLIFVLPPNMPYWGGYHATAITADGVKRPYAIIGLSPFYDILSPLTTREMIDRLKEAPLEALLDSKVTIPDPKKSGQPQPVVYSGIGAIMTHEFAEMITDPDIESDPNDKNHAKEDLQAWTSKDGGDEIADPAEGNYCYMYVGNPKIKVEVSGIYSNRDKGIFPPPDTDLTPYPSLGQHR
jgi:hypothetical protein